MIPDLDIGGVFLPGLLVLALAALAGTVAMVRLFAAAGLFRLTASRPLVELATFAILYGLLLQALPSSGTFQ
ncbi:hypothetical protein J2848_003230 [Azospirillum lipoferum]|uniref:DUF1656 domain-containing protein n=1 Tax=Azospirillum lipoferum TaxID=193 RepID=A0A5A9GPD5_AZOLI|nr:MULTISPECIES: DUF1656 domain-containing protein [Azospirillum]KAA0595592.1 DUF1656 domain-containing protein [Azospirillum lipoferum]MCP1611557.1 hypothetical protein [Azospirillum lipoferum]MDW5537357.1 DUF1656 domain-containing protein [Azospirillum sp. NL1]